MSTSSDISDLRSLAQQLLSTGPHKTYPGAPRRIRIQVSRAYIADSRASVYVWEHAYYPYLYLPRGDFSSEVQWEKVETVQGGAATIYAISVKGKTVQRVLAFGEGNDVPESLRGLVRVEFGAADAWFEESVPIRVHPKDPFKRVDVLPSTSAIGVSVQGTTLAKAPFAMHLYETGLPVRYYLPVTSIAQEYLRPSKTRTQCPYKGEAEYFDVVLPDGKGGEETFKDLVWYYNAPNLECAEIKGLACFYNEKVDLEVDGVKEHRPVTGMA